jgi:hypothetical protein
MGVYLTGVHLMGVHLIDVYFMFDFPNPKSFWPDPYLTNGGAVVDLSRSELQNTRFCASCGVVPYCAPQAPQTELIAVR